MDIAQLTNAPREVAIGPVTYKVRPLKFKEWGIVQQWIKDNADDPMTDALASIDKARRRGVAVSPDHERMLIQEAKGDMGQWPPQVMTPAWFNLMGRTVGATIVFLRVCLGIHQPGLTDEHLEAIDATATPEETEAVFSAAIGAADLPKGSGPGGDGSPSPGPLPAPPAPARPGGKGRRPRRATSGATSSTPSAGA